MDSSVLSGPRGMKLKRERMSVLAVFQNDDALTSALSSAAKRCQVSLELSTNQQAALNSFRQSEHDVVLLDHRHAEAGSSADLLCRQLREVSSVAREHCVICAVVPSPERSTEEDSFLQLLDKGYNKRIFESVWEKVWAEELLQLEQNEVVSSCRLRALEAALAALDHVTDPVEISNEMHEVEFINSAYRTSFGFALDEAMGHEMFRWDRGTEEKKEAISETIKNGDTWRGHLFSAKRNGSLVPHQTTITPVMGNRRRIQHYVSVKRPLASDGFPTMRLRTNSYDAYSMSSGPRYSFNGSVHTQRRDSLGKKIQALALDTPIAKVIHLIYEAQENSNPLAAQTLDRALDILQTSDLYTAGLTNSQQQDRMTSDLIEGLMTNAKMLHDRTERRRLSSGVGLAKRNSRNSEVLREHIQQVLETHNASNSDDGTLPVPVDVKKCLRRDKRWNFDILELERITAKKPLVFLGLSILRRFRACEVLNCSMVVLQNWLSVMQRNYHIENPYHNATHAADVLQSAAYFLEKDAVQEHLSRLDEIACLIGAIIHDLNHPARTNIFLINANHKLAILYNDISVLESHHVSLAFQLTQKDERIDIFRNMKNREEFQLLRGAIIDLVLATEMAKHSEHLFKFECVAKLLDNRTSDIGEAEREQQLSKMEYPAVVRRMLIKCSDVNNPCRPLRTCREWAKRIAREYFDQTDDERTRNQPVSMPIFDRKNGTNIAASQVSFVDFFVREMYQVWSEFCKAPECLNIMDKNYLYWRRKKSRESGDTVDDEEEDEEEEEEEDDEEEEATDDELDAKQQLKINQDNIVVLDELEAT